MESSQESTYIQFSLTQPPKTFQTHVITEQPVSLTVNGELWFTWMCTPSNLDALAVGFLFNEGYVRELTEVEEIYVCPAKDNIDVWLSHAVEKPKHWHKTSGCTGGVTSQTGDTTTNRVRTRKPNRYQTITGKQVVNLIDGLFENQALYKQTGGVHTSALSDGVKILTAAEDVGRHNTLDKIAGRFLIDKIQADQIITLSTGRISSEMLQKASRIGSDIVISRTAPTSLSIQMAEDLQITLIGYARRNQFNIYTCHYRIVETKPELSG